MKSIFISYRRDDSLATAGRIRDRLGVEFGMARVFVDVEDISAGADFVQVLDRRLAECAVLLAIIGPSWGNARDAAGNSRLENPDDFVRMEIATALARNIPVIPVLIDGAQMPSVETLPEALRPLSRKNAFELRNSLFSSDAQRLVRAINAQPTMRPDHGWWRWAAALLVCCAAAVAGYLAWPDLRMLVAGQQQSRRAAIDDRQSPKAAPAAQDTTKQIERLRALLASGATPLQIGLRGGNKLRLGEQVIFEITSPIRGRLILLDVNAAGQLTQIFPNRFASSDEIAVVQAAKPVSVPGPGYGFTGFKAVEPVGRGRLIAVVQPLDARPEPLDIVRTEVGRGFEPVAAPASYLRVIADLVEASALGARSTGKGMTGWGFAIGEYEILE